MAADEVQKLLAQLNAKERADTERFLATWDFMHGQETAEDKELRLRAVASYLGEFGDGDGGGGYLFRKNNPRSE